MSGRLCGNARADGEQIEMHGDRERRECDDGPVVERLTQSVPQGSETGPGPVGPPPCAEGQGEHDHDDREQGGPRQPPHGRESERDGDDLRGCENVDGEDEPDRRAQAQTTRREHCGRDDERERAAQDEHAHAPRLTRSSSSGIRYRRVPRSRAWYAMSSPSCRAPRSSADGSVQAPAASSPALGRLPLARRNVWILTSRPASGRA